jgi:NADPH-dependent 2,4-dienoyl-CoA reductase/sulfur reductase-like enzyme
MTGVKVKEFRGEGDVSRTVLSDGAAFDTDAVVCGIGGVPNTDLAQAAGIDLGRGKGIWTDEYMRTVDPSIFAVGDCAGKRDFFTRKNAAVMLASVATAEARIAGANLYKLRAVRQIQGTIGVFSTYVGGLVMGAAGLTEREAIRGDFDFVTGRSEGTDKHPGKLPSCSKIKLKLLFSKNGGILLGGQVSGSFSAGEIVNIIGMAIQKHFTASELETFQMATHPYLTPPPTKYHLVIAAQDALRSL